MTPGQLRHSAGSHSLTLSGPPAVPKPHLKGTDIPEHVAQDARLGGSLTWGACFCTFWKVPWCFLRKESFPCGPGREGRELTGFQTHRPHTPPKCRRAGGQEGADSTNGQAKSATGFVGWSQAQNPEGSEGGAPGPEDPHELIYPCGSPCFQSSGAAAGAFVWFQALSPAQRRRDGCQHRPPPFSFFLMREAEK